MKLVLKSGLSKHESEDLQSRKTPKALLLYQERGFVNSTIELLRDATARISEELLMFCAIWDFDFLADPLLAKAAAREASAADIVIVALHVGDELPAFVRDWLHLWLWIHPSDCAARENPGFTAHYFDSPPAAFQFEQVGNLGDINLITVGGTKEPGLATLKTELSLALVLRTYEPPTVAARTALPGQAALGKGILRDSRAACSGHRVRWLC